MEGASGACAAPDPTHDDETVMNGAPGIITGGGFEGGEDFWRGVGDTVGGCGRAVERRVLRLVGFAAGADGGLFLFGAGAAEFGEELFGEAAVAGSWVVGDELVAGREGSEAFVEDDLFDGLGGLCGDRFRASLGEVGGGDLEAVEEEAGAARVDLVGGYAAEDVDDGELEAGAVVAVGEVEVEGALAAAADTWMRGGLARGVVVVAELFVAERGRAAAAAVGVDVAALEAFWLCVVGHDVFGAPTPVCAQSLRTIWVRSGLRFGLGPELKCGEPGFFGRALCVSISILVIRAGRCATGLENFWRGGYAAGLVG